MRLFLLLLFTFLVFRNLSLNSYTHTHTYTSPERSPREILMDLDATHNIFKNKYPKAKEEMEERLQVRTHVYMHVHVHVHVQAYYVLDLFINIYFSSILMLLCHSNRDDNFMLFINIVEET